MKKIEAVIRKEKFPAVDSALKQLGVGGLTVEDVVGRGRTKETETIMARGRWTVEEEFIKRLKLEILVDDSQAQRVVESILANASTGQAGDGKIFVTTVDEVLDIGTKAANEEAVAFATTPHQN
jgi:nitrogen regulatory protein P-II 1